jgi:adenylate cyclase
MSQARRLAAILAAELAGYSRLMGADEEGTHERLKAHLQELVNPKITEHRGRVVKNTGDGMLAEFPSVVDAVRCAVEIQRGMGEREPEMPEERRIRFRIGINLGDVIVEEHDIFGDGVNVAARLEALAKPGGISVSRVVRDQVRDRLDYAFEDMGQQQVKNIARPVRVYRLREPAASVEEPLPASPQPLPLPDKPSIAVLPFTNMSADPEQEFFADGIAEDIITALYRYPSLLVIARNSSFTYKRRAVDVKQVGRELGVRYVLEGSLRKSGNRTRHGAIGRGRDRQSRLGRALRPRSRRYLRCARRDHRGRNDCGCASHPRRRAPTGRTKAGGQPRCLGCLSARLVASLQTHRQRQHSRTAVL